MQCLFHCTSLSHVLYVQPTGGSPQEVRHPSPLPSFAIALFCMYNVPLLIPGLAISPSQSLYFKQQEIAFYTSTLLVCIKLLVQDKTNGFLYPLYISCSELSQLVRLIAEHLHGEDLQTILVIPAMMRGSVVELMEYVLIEMCILCYYSMQKLLRLLHSMLCMH